MEPIIPFDFERMFLGSDPSAFYLEITFRVLVIWLWAMALLRWIGGRSIAQLSLVEFLLVIALGSAVGDVMFYPEVPLFHAMLVVAILVILDKLIDVVIRRFRTAKMLIDGEPVELLRDGVMHCDAMGMRQLGSAELMEMLRLRGVENLGSLRAVYLEPSGQLSIFAAMFSKHGLAIVPPRELAPPSGPSGLGEICCDNCGFMTDPDDRPPQPCENCGNTEWVDAEPAPPWQGAG